MHCPRKSHPHLSCLKHLSEYTHKLQNVVKLKNRAYFPELELKVFEKFNWGN